MAWHVWVIWFGFAFSLFVLWLAIKERSRSTPVDPVAEANIYLAYGRRKQAIDVLRCALVANPNDQVVRIKLAELTDSVEP